MAYVMVDIEADGPIPGDYSMIALGAVVVEPGLESRFRILIRPISDRFVADALAVSGFTREECFGPDFVDGATAMETFARWVKEHATPRPMFVSDNNGFDWMFVAWYFHHFIGRNPFGHSSTNLGSLYKGLVRDMKKNFKHLRETPHTHDPLDDAIGNAQAMLTILEEMQ